MGCLGEFKRQIEVTVCVFSAGWQARQGPRYRTVQARQQGRVGHALGGSQSVLKRSQRLHPVPQAVLRFAVDPIEQRMLCVAHARHRAHALHHGHDGRQRADEVEGRPAQNQGADGRCRVACLGSTPAGCNEVVDVGAALGDGAVFVKAGKVLPMARGAGAGGALAMQCQPLDGVVVHAAQQVEPAARDHTQQRLLDQGLKHVRRPRCAWQCRQVEHSLGRGQREPAFEHGKLRKGRPFSL